jgi:uncharacterized protein YkwD
MARLAVQVGLVGLVAVALVAAPASGARGGTEQRLWNVESQILREINATRVDQGLRPLKTSPALRAAAVAHTRAMLHGGFFAHDSADGTSAPSRIARQYPMRANRSWSVGETLFTTSGVMSARQTVDAWLASPPHREILLAPQWREVGIGVARADQAGGDFGGMPATVATADFGTR